MGGGRWRASECASRGCGVQKGAFFEPNFHHFSRPDGPQNFYEVAKFDTYSPRKRVFDERIILRILFFCAGECAEKAFKRRAEWARCRQEKSSARSCKSQACSASQTEPEYGAPGPQIATSIFSSQSKNTIIFRVFWLPLFRIASHLPRKTRA